jgi:hypothetical protein
LLVTIRSTGLWWQHLTVLSQLFTIKKPACCKILHEALELAGSCDNSNEPSCSIKCGEFLD